MPESLKRPSPLYSLLRIKIAFVNGMVDIGWLSRWELTFSRSKGKEQGHITNAILSRRSNRELGKQFRDSMLFDEMDPGIYDEAEDVVAMPLQSPIVIQAIAALECW